MKKYSLKKYSLIITLLNEAVFIVCSILGLYLWYATNNIYYGLIGIVSVAISIALPIIFSKCTNEE